MKSSSPRREEGFNHQYPVTHQWIINCFGIENLKSEIDDPSLIDDWALMIETILAASRAIDDFQVRHRLHSGIGNVKSEIDDPSPIDDWALVIEIILAAS